MLIKAGINLFLNEDQTCFRVINPSLISKKVDILTSPVFWQVITSAGRIWPSDRKRRVPSWSTQNTAGLNR